MTVEGEHYGKFKGFIRDNKDPENRGRVRCFCPQIMGAADVANQWLGWAEPCFPWFGGLSSGDFGPPFTREEQKVAYGSEYFGVWLEFQQGHIDFPIWVGTFTIAPRSDSKSSHSLGIDGGPSQPGGGIIQNSDSGGMDSLNPPKAGVRRELRLRVPIGVDIFIGSEKGGSIIVGPSGVHLVGPQITLNGQAHFSSSTRRGGV
jgi:hypothetical protein